MRLQCNSPHEYLSSLGVVPAACPWKTLPRLGGGGVRLGPSRDADPAWTCEGPTHKDLEG